MIVTDVNMVSSRPALQARDEILTARDEVLPIAANSPHVAVSDVEPVDPVHGLVWADTSPDDGTLRLKVFHDGGWHEYPAKVFTESGWQSFTPRNISGIKRIWPRSVTPPPPGTHYAWLGEPHASVSVKLDSNGNETARNLASNPSFELGAEDGWLKGARVGFGSTTAAEGRFHHGERSRVLRWDDDATEIQTVVYVPVDVVSGDWVAISAWIATNSGNTLFVRPVISEYTNDNNAWISHNYKTERQRLLQEEMSPVSFAYQVTAEDVETARTGLVFSSGLREYRSPTGYAYLDAVNIAVADSESTALAQVETYFDGDTPPDRANDLWYNTDGVPHEWINGQGWTPTH